MKKFLIVAAGIMVSVASISCDSKSNSEENNAANTATAAIEGLADQVVSAADSLKTVVTEKLADFGEGLIGTYVAKLPAADASANEATLVINADLTYTLTESFVGKDTIETTGKITDGDFAARTITFTNNEGVATLYKVVEGGNLLLLNADGTEPEDVAAYTFTRK